MFLKCNHAYRQAGRRLKDGKEHRYWSIVESRRCATGQVAQRPVLYLGEINDSQRQSWCKTIAAFDPQRDRTLPLALFPADRPLPEHAADYLPAGRHGGVQVRLDQMELRRPRQWGACWLACQIYEQLGLDRFWTERLPAGRQACPTVAKALAGGTFCKRSAAIGSLIRGVSGVCTGSGSSKARWAICSEPILRWWKRMRSIARWTRCSNTSRRSFRICRSAGATCSARSSTCCFTI